jgi:hypothetical protein
MKYTYINLDGNITETEDVVKLPDHIEQIGRDFFEKRVSVEKVVKVAKVEEVKEIAPTSNIEDEAKLFLKEKKVKGYQFLK